MSFYEDALKIFAICIDNSISETDARVLTYIHSKIIEKGNNYFLSPPKEEELAITIMLGQHNESTFSEHDIDPRALRLFNQVAKKIQEIDIQLHQRMGIENRLHSELRGRLLIYTDKKYRKKMLSIYTNLIIPQMIKYTQDRIRKVINNHLSKIKDIDDFLDNLDL
mgnify:CR=1 FL=1